MTWVQARYDFIIRPGEPPYSENGQTDISLTPSR